jgi:hypothetical protein
LGVGAAGAVVGGGTVASAPAGATVPAAGAVVAAATGADASAAHAAFPLPCPELHEPSASATVGATALNAAADRTAPATKRPNRGARRRRPTQPWLTTLTPRSRLELRLSVGRATRTTAETTRPGSGTEERSANRQSPGRRCIGPPTGRPAPFTARGHVSCSPMATGIRRCRRPPLSASTRSLEHPAPAPEFGASMTGHFRQPHLRRGHPTNPPRHRGRTDSGSHEGRQSGDNGGRLLGHGRWSRTDGDARAA